MMPHRDPGTAGRQGFARAVALVVALLLLGSCSSFMKQEDEQSLFSLEERTFVMKETVSINGNELKKGDSVMLVITTGEEWVKVEAFLKSQGKLKGTRVRLLYLFKQDFPDEKYSESFLTEQLFRFLGEKV